MRILIVSHAPLATELGAAQIALNLASALKDRGHDAQAWSPEPLPPARYRWQAQRRALESFVAEHGPFDVIDTPATTAGSGLGKLVVRSIQPEMLYLWQDVQSDLRRRPPSPRSMAHALIAAPRAVAILGGWRRASLILCMGKIERSWMARRFPRWRGKLSSYVCAPSLSERSALIEVRRRRAAPEGEGIRFLWIGRWAAHKGTARLLRFLAERLSHGTDSCTIAGCGPGAQKDIPSEWVRSGRVRLVPVFTRMELPELLLSHDAGLFTSTVEGWGLSLNEMLESGMPVYASEAGAVADLRPFFPASLRPFPPPARIEPSAREDLEANGYFARFNWAAIAESYEEAVLARHAG